MRINEIEFRQSKNCTPEIVRWAPDADSERGEFCYTLMFFDREREGYNARFIGSRPFDYGDSTALWNLMTYAQRLLDAKFALEDG